MFAFSRSLFLEFKVAYDPSQREVIYHISPSEFCISIPIDVYFSYFYAFWARGNCLGVPVIPPVAVVF